MNVINSQGFPKLGVGAQGGSQKEKEWAEFYACGLEEVQERLARYTAKGAATEYPSNGALLKTFEDELVRFELEILVPAFIALATKFPMKERSGLLVGPGDTNKGSEYGVAALGTRGVFLGTEEDVVTVLETSPLSWVYSVLMEHGCLVQPTVFTEQVGRWQMAMSNRFARMGLSLTSELYPAVKMLKLRVKPL